MKALRLLGALWACYILCVAAYAVMMSMTGRGDEPVPTIIVITAVYPMILLAVCGVAFLIWELLKWALHDA